MKNNIQYKFFFMKIPPFPEKSEHKKTAAVLNFNNKFKQGSFQQSAQILQPACFAVVNTELFSGISIEFPFSDLADVTVNISLIKGIAVTQSMEITGIHICTIVGKICPEVTAAFLGFGIAVHKHRNFGGTFTGGYSLIFVAVKSKI